MGKVWDVLAPRNLELGPLAGQVLAGQARAPSPWRNWLLARDDDGIAWLALDKANASANTLSEDVLAELNDVLATLERDMPKGLVLRSAKPKGFIAGADIGEFRGMTDAAAVQARVIQAHAVVDRLDRLAAPTVAVVHGYCLGGGLEIALACDYRIAVEDASLGFPEVMLGLHPGLGGTVRLPQLINPLEAMTMMLTGRNARARRAKSLVLVDAVVPERHVKAAATAAATGQLKKRRGGVLGELINSTYGRKLAAKRMRAETEKKAPAAHYPAPHALIDLWEAHGGNAQDMQRAEIASFARLIVTHTSRNLVRVFFLREKLKGLADGEFPGRHVHVIGAGAMGGDIAAWCAWQGFTVTLADTQADAIARAIARAAELYGKIGHKRIDIRDALDRLTPDLAGEGVRSAARAARRIAAAQSPRGPAFLHSGVAHAAGRGGEPRPDLVRGSRQGARVPRTHRSPARAGQKRAGIFGQPRGHALHARGAGDAQRGREARDHRRRRRDLRHAHGADRACRYRRPRHLPARGRDPQGQSRPADARRVAGAARQGRGGSSRAQERQGLLRMAARRGGEGARRAQAHAGDDGPTHSSHARRLRRLPARGRGGG